MITTNDIKPTGVSGEGRKLNHVSTDDLNQPRTLPPVEQRLDPEKMITTHNVVGAENKPGTNPAGDGEPVQAPLPKKPGRPRGAARG